MIENGKWATEVEILGLSHLLKTDIYIYSDNRWVLFSRRMVDPDFDIDQLGSICTLKIKIIMMLSQWYRVGQLIYNTNPLHQVARA